MIRRKLTERLKETIKSDFKSLRKKDFDGEALAYLNRVKGAHKGRVTQKRQRKEQKEKLAALAPSDTKGAGKGKGIVVGGKSYAPGTQVYEIIKLSAINKNQTVAKFIKENRDALEELLKNYLIFAKKEIDDLRKLIKALPKSTKIYSPVRRSTTSARNASFILHMIKKTLVEICSIYPIVFIEYAFDLDGSLHFACPRPGEYKDFEDCFDLKEFIDDRYPNITYIEHDNVL